MTDGEREIIREQEVDARDIAESEPPTGQIIDAGDLEYGWFIPNVLLFGKGRWERKMSSRSLLITFATEEDLMRAIDGGIVHVSYEPLPKTQ